MIQILSRKVRDFQYCSSISPWVYSAALCTQEKYDELHPSFSSSSSYTSSSLFLLDGVAWFMPPPPFHEKSSSTLSIAEDNGVIQNIIPELFCRIILLNDPWLSLHCIWAGRLASSISSIQLFQLWLTYILLLVILQQLSFLSFTICTFIPASHATVHSCLLIRIRKSLPAQTVDFFHLYQMIYSHLILDHYTYRVFTKCLVICCAQKHCHALRSTWLTNILLTVVEGSPERYEMKKYYNAGALKQWTRIFQTFIVLKCSTINL